jgi:Ca2+-binding EF-hand superfamily protein
MKKLLFSAAAAGVLVAADMASAQAAPQGARAAMANKTETRTEVPAQVQRMFARLDTNKDGFVTKAEADAAVAQVEAKAAKRFDSGKIFARLDANKDGNVTQAEADAAYAALAAKRGKPVDAKAHGFTGLFKRGDANKDGTINRAEFDAATGMMKARMESSGAKNFGDRLFATEDLNKDGKVAVAEAQQVALQRFDKADLNRDGKLTAQERQQARSAKSAKR